MSKTLSSNHYFPNGTWESAVIDLGIGWEKTNSINIEKEIPSNTEMSLMISSSSDNNTFTNYVTFDKNNIPQERYIKFMTTMSATPSGDSVNGSYTYDQKSKETKVELNEYTKAKGRLTIKVDYELKMNKDILWFDEGSVYRKTINKSNWKTINTISVK